MLIGKGAIQSDSPSVLNLEISTAAPCHSHSISKRHQIDYICGTCLHTRCIKDRRAFIKFSDWALRMHMTAQNDEIPMMPPSSKTDEWEALRRAVKVVRAEGHTACTCGSTGCGNMGQDREE